MAFIHYLGLVETTSKQPAISALGCEHSWEALLCLPKHHVDRREASRSLRKVPTGRPVLFEATVGNVRSFDRNDRETRSPYPAYVAATLQFDDASVVVRFYRASPSEWAGLLDGRVVFQGVVSRSRTGVLYINEAALDAISGHVDAVYSGAQGQISGAVITALVSVELAREESFSEAARHIAESSAAREVLTEFGRSSRWLIRNLHQPQSLQDADQAMSIAKRCCIQSVRLSARPAIAPGPAEYNVDVCLIARVKEQPEVLSQGQREALNTIRLAVNTQCPANILLNGDVGTGKTLVFLLASAAIAEASGRDVAVLVPSDLVARQIHKQATSRFPSLSPQLITAGTSASLPERSGPRMLIGTQALLNATNLDLAALVVDEQHKFSVEQRRALAGSRTHIIEASATPIPRTLALALFDGWHYAVIKSAPVEKTIENYVLPESDRRIAVGLLKKHLTQGQRVIFLYPSVNGKGGNSVTAKGASLQEFFPGKVACVHGKLSDKEKEQAIEAFRSGQAPILVSTTVVEVGVDVPDVGMMLVSGAERFGVSQLHQLRGRLVRNGGHGSFVMFTGKTVPQKTMARLQAVRDFNDGFSLAQRDLELRGFGDVIGESQRGQVKTLFHLSRLEPSDFL